MSDRCRRCGAVDKFSVVVSVIQFHVPLLARPHPMIPTAGNLQDPGFRFCTACDAAYIFIEKAKRASSAVRFSGDWTRAVILFDDGESSEYRNCPAKPVNA